MRTKILAQKHILQRQIEFNDEGRTPLGMKMNIFIITLHAIFLKMSINSLGNV